MKSCLKKTLPSHVCVCVCVCRVTTQIVYSFNIFLEVGALVPQLLYMSKNGPSETITGHYLLAFLCFRVLDVVDQLYKFYVEYSYDTINNVAGAVHTCFFLDLVYLQLCGKSELSVSLSLSLSNSSMNDDCCEISSLLKVIFSLSYYYYCYCCCCHYYENYYYY